MANSVIATVAHDGARNVLVEVTGILDTSDVAPMDITNLSALNPAPGMLRLDTVQFAIEDGLACMLWWHDTAQTLITPLAGRGKHDYAWFGGRNNPQNAGWTGNIMLSTAGWTGIKHFSLLLDLIKQQV
jgi:hypothetical protein